MTGPCIPDVEAYIKVGVDPQKLTPLSHFLINLMVPSAKASFVAFKRSQTSWPRAEKGFVSSKLNASSAISLQGRDPCVIDSQRASLLWLRCQMSLLGATQDGSLSQRHHLVRKNPTRSKIPKVAHRLHAPVQWHKGQARSCGHNLHSFLMLEVISPFGVTRCLQPR